MEKPLEAARWQMLEDTFGQAVELPPEQRDAYCARTCSGDPELLEELRALLRAHADGTGLLEQPPGAVRQGAIHDPGLPQGTRAGVWSIGRLIRRGGSGEVYEATRADGAFDQKVALKLLYRDAEPDIERFHAERQILASLDHPGIARLLDGGVTPEGRLYAVVEFVDGETIVEHCLRLQADVAYRLEVFLQVCQVVAYAHSNLVVHRDLKPGNILVTREGRVKLLDFGVAKRLARAEPLDADATRAPYTADYAAPEQLTGQPITTATDVYALGVLLFELLCGQRPWHSEGLPLARLVQLIVHDEPPSLSGAAAASAAPPVPPRRLRGDLDAIVATCLRKEAAGRYPTVEALSLEIVRHLHQEPVRARGRARLYVLGRAFRRHRWAVTAGTLVFASLSIGLAAAMSQAHRAEVERDTARRAATREEAIRYHLTNLFRSSIAQKSDAPVTAKIMLDRSARRVLDQYRDDPQLAGKVVVTLADLYGALEDVEGQVPLLEGFLEAAGPEADPESVALSQQKLAYIELLRGHVPRAAELLAKAESLWNAKPAKYREQHLEALFIRGLLLRNQGDLDGSIRTYRDAIVQRTAFSGEAHRETANLYNSLAISLTGANRLQEALDAYRTNLSIYERLGQGDDLDALVVLGNTGTLAYRVGRLREAQSILKSAFGRQRERAGDSAAVAASMGLYGAALTADNRLSEALDMLRTATEMAVKFTGTASPLALQNRLFLTDALSASRRFAEATTLGQQNLVLATERFGPNGLLTLRMRLSQARLALESGAPDRAQTEFAALVEPLRRAGRPGVPFVAQALYGTGEALLAQRRPAAAIEPLRESIALREPMLWPQSWELALGRARLGEALRATGDAGARPLLTRSLADLEDQLDADHPQVLRLRQLVSTPF